MPHLPSLTAKDVVQALKRAGFVKNRQKGSHLVLVHPQSGTRTVIPMHAGKTIKKPLLYAIITEAKLSVDAFLNLL
ncbi:hypothetical protein BK004_00490 [bacterium CG10_46_32]|nr:MAG: hypothetical protein BK004_00490 [bacterium CG10_46_32]PIR56505.1 MAG: hypothetical protein COU73_00485 [Parcubacteria group bacterium CG10_big_fil_rev_8_21_14_0_10_46_32]